MSIISGAAVNLVMLISNHFFQVFADATEANLHSAKVFHYCAQFELSQVSRSKFMFELTEILAKLGKPYIKKPLKCLRCLVFFYYM